MPSEHDRFEPAAGAGAPGGQVGDYFAGRPSPSTGLGSALPLRPYVDPRQAPHRRGRAAVAALVAATVAVSGAIWWQQNHRLDHTPLTLPATLDGIPQLPDNVDFGQSPSFATTIHEEIGDATWLGRGYAAGRGSTPQLTNILVARTDLSGKVDLHLASEPFTRFGPVTCTTTIQLPSVAGLPQSPPVSGRMALCWRTSHRLSVTALVTYGSVTDDYLPTLAAQVTEIWDAQP